VGCGVADEPLAVVDGDADGRSGSGMVESACV
jgi:hypothetical protein